MKADSRKRRRAREARTVRLNADVSAAILYRQESTVCAGASLNRVVACVPRRRRNRTRRTGKHIQAIAPWNMRLGIQCMRDAAIRNIRVLNITAVVASRFASDGSLLRTSLPTWVVNLRLSILLIELMVPRVIRLRIATGQQDHSKAVTLRRMFGSLSMARIIRSRNGRVCPALPRRQSLEGCVLDSPIRMLCFCLPRTNGNQ